MAYKQGCSRQDVYHRLLLNPVGIGSTKRPQPETLTEYIHAIDFQVTKAGSEHLGRGLEAKQLLLDATRLAYHAMRKFGVVYRLNPDVEGKQIQAASTTGSLITDSDVQAGIDTERDYQNKTWPDTDGGKGPDVVAHSISDFALLMRDYIDRTKKAWVNCQGDHDALDMIRKVAGIGVRALEEWGIASV